MSKGILYPVPFFGLNSPAQPIVESRLRICKTRKQEHVMRRKEQRQHRGHIEFNPEGS